MNQINQIRQFPYEDAIRDGTARIAAQALGEAKSVSDVSRLYDSTLQFVIQFNDDIAGKEPPPRPVACKKGCAFCCANIHIHATPVEVLRIVQHVAEEFSEKRQKKVLQQVVEGDGHPTSPCPLLIGGACSVYAVRPLTCRGFNSYNATQCELKIRYGVSSTIGGYAHPQKITQAALDGLRLGILEQGLAPDVLELRLALKIAFIVEGAGERWLAGEDLFQAAEAQITDAPEAAENA